MELPTGTVTLLFSDMEGSTRLLARLGEQYATALDEQRRILRAAWAAHGGVELGTEGDSFFIAFADAPSAVRGAVDAQRGLGLASWPGGERILVRIGVHTGAPVRHGDGYVGMDVHRAARVMSAARGGQVLVTAATAGLVGVDGIEFRDLGRHVLKDLPDKEHLFQVLAPGLQSEFGPVRAMGSTANLPEPSTPLIGRDHELPQLAALFRQPQPRLVTLTGPGGTGKTRLAIALATSLADLFADGTFFVALETTTSGQEIWPALLDVLDVPPEARSFPGLFAQLANVTSLVVLDNLEQIEDAAPVVRQLMEAAPRIRVLATSRQPLHLVGEQEYVVPPLDLPDIHDPAADRASAVELFVSSARLVNASFALTDDNRAVVLEICRQLDGLPLALELAAARLKWLTAKALLTRLDQALDLRSANIDRTARHQTLRQTIAWSYELLDPAAQRMLGCLSVFSGGADLGAVEFVWSAVNGSGTDTLDLLQRLVDASLVNVTQDREGEPRVGMLRTIEVFAEERLAGSPDEEDAHEAAVAYFDALMRSLETERSPHWRDRLTARLELEHSQCRACITWLLERVEASVAVDEESVRLRTIRLSVALQMTFRLNYWMLALRGHHAEAAQWAERVIAAAGQRRGLRVAACLSTLAAATFNAGRSDLGARQAEAAHEMLDDAETDADLSDAEADPMRFSVMTVQVMRLFASGELEGAAEVLERDIQTTDDPTPRAIDLIHLAEITVQRGRPAEALPHLEEAEQLAEMTGNDALASRASLQRAATHYLLGDLSRAEREFRAAFPQMLAAREPQLELQFGDHYAATIADLGRASDAGLLMGAVDAMRRRLAMPRLAEDEQLIDKPLERAKRALGDTWAQRLHAGEMMTVEQALTRVIREPGGTDKMS